MNILGRSIFARYQQLHGVEIELAADAYPAEYVIDIAKKIQAQDGDRWLNKSENEWLEHFTATGIRENLVEVKAVLNSINIPFDNWFSEQTLHRSGKVAALMEKYVADGMAYRADKPRGVEERVRREDSKAAQYAEQQAGGLFLRPAGLVMMKIALFKEPMERPFTSLRTWLIISIKQNAVSRGLLMFSERTMAATCRASRQGSRQRVMMQRPTSLFWSKWFV